MAEFQDIYMRDYAGDDGQVPSDLRQGVSQSPDIIPAGTVPYQDYQTQLASNYNGPFDYYHNIDPNNYNYIYVRGFNNFPGNQSGSVNLYWSPASLLLYPPNWINNKIPNANTTTAATLPDTPTGQVVVGQGAFYWHPGSISSGDHFCLIAQVVTQQDPNPLPGTIPGPTGNDIEEFAAWVANNADIAWRNVALVATPTKDFTSFVQIMNPSNQPSNFTLTITCVDIPDGTDISVLGSEPTPPISLSFTVGPGNLIPPSAPGGPKVNTYGWPLFDIPGGFKEAVSITANGPATFPLGSSITPTYYWLIPVSHALAATAVHPSEFNMTAMRAGEEEEDGVMVPLGDFSFQF